MSASAEPSPASRRVRCDRLYDGSGGTVQEDVEVRIESGRIVELAPRGSASGADSDAALDLSGYFVVPGLVDAHDHLAFDVGDVQAQAAEGSVRLALRAARNAEAMLAAGITSMRDLGEPDDLATTLKDAIAGGMLRGPSLSVARTWITRTGGHAWFAAREADGPDDVRRAVREQARGGCDWIKVVSTGGVMTRGSQPFEPGLGASELQAAVDEAHALGFPVSVHAIGGPGLTAAIEAGVDTVEHGFFATDRDLDLMAERDTALVSTYGVIEIASQASHVPAPVRDKAKAACEATISTLVRARERGITVGVGCDLRHAALVRELEILLEAGWDRAEALHVVTDVNAQIARFPDAGRIDVGRSADLLALDGDPLVSLETLRSPKLVMRAGEVLIDRRPSQRSGAGRAGPDVDRHRDDDQSTERDPLVDVADREQVEPVADHRQQQ